eukprot:761957-Hanusia_phi.AAC.3
MSSCPPTPDAEEEDEIRDEAEERRREEWQRKKEQFLSEHQDMWYATGVSGAQHDGSSSSAPVPTERPGLANAGSPRAAVGHGEHEEAGGFLLEAEEEDQESHRRQVLQDVVTVLPSRAPLKQAEAPRLSSSPPRLHARSIGLFPLEDSCQMRAESLGETTLQVPISSPPSPTPCSSQPPLPPLPLLLPPTRLISLPSYCGLA